MWRIRVFHSSCPLLALFFKSSRSSHSQIYIPKISPYKRIYWLDKLVWFLNNVSELILFLKNLRVFFVVCLAQNSIYSCFVFHFVRNIYHQSSQIESFILDISKYSSRGVLIKRCFENMQLIYRIKPMWKSDFNKVALQIYWNHTSAWVSSCKLAAYFQNNFLKKHLWRDLSEYSIITFQGFLNSFLYYYNTIIHESW